MNLESQSFQVCHLSFRLYHLIKRIGVFRIQGTWCATVPLCRTATSPSSTMTLALIGTTTTPSARVRATIHSKEQFHSITSVSLGSPYFL